MPPVTVTKFIMPCGNHGNDAKLLPNPPAGEPDPDSDDPDGDAPSSDAGQHALSKRNVRFLTKHALQVSASSPSCARRRRSMSSGARRRPTVSSRSFASSVASTRTPVTQRSTRQRKSAKRDATASTSSSSSLCRRGSPPSDRCGTENICKFIVSVV